MALGGAGAAGASMLAGIAVREAAARLVKALVSIGVLAGQAFRKEMPFFTRSSRPCSRAKTTSTIRIAPESLPAKRAFGQPLRSRT